ncbi:MULTISPECIES: cell division protein ZapA [unclassified Prosthecochloris]|uniref:cell division protein ZapA n=1 Tax=unclassified Prosthecochloris TaxID=2632826 RepID=UPI00223E2A90|nr:MULTISPECIES: cell division protein ZapA [unclassified Prosthecochloris]UZJ38442.1 cell division protein ZapA [Prosthecochloris sp. SCSIO W1103]
MEKINVNIFGDNYPLRVESRESTEQAAFEVDEIMQQFAGKAPDLEVKKFAVLAAIHFAEKKNELMAKLSSMEKKIDQLNLFLEQNSF